MADDGFSYAVKVGIACVLIGILMPIGLGLIINATTGSEMSGADATVVVVFGTLLPILVVIGLAIALMPESIKSKVGLWYIPSIPTAQIPQNEKKTVSICALSAFEAIG